ncbi:hypothetical protein [Vibrio sp. R78045]|uniref:hypothetical protein n=1 Tax=Vibrio sp. R78045 TaxID=3093868 RepID=UPI0036F195AD
MGIENREAEIDKSIQNTNQLLSRHITKIANKRNIVAVAATSIILILFGMQILYAKHALNRSSGVFKVSTNQQTNAISANLIIDSEHYFDDRVALVQSGMTKNLTMLFTHTTISYLKREDQWRELTTELGLNDIQSNAEHISVDEMMTDKDMIRQMTFQLTNGIPLVIKPHFPLGTTEAQIQDEDERNALEVVKWTLETEGIIKVKTGTRDSNTKIKFNFDVIPTHPSYKASSLKISRMSLWMVTR